MTLPSNLSAIRQKFRRIIAQNSALQIPDSTIDEYINTFYVYDLPLHVPLFNMKEAYTFYTQPLVDVYNFPRNQYIGVQPPAYIAGYQSFFSQSREQFYRTFPKINFLQQASTASGAAGPYTFTLTQRPILRASTNENGQITSDLVISTLDGSGLTAYQVIDNGSGGLIAFGTVGPVLGSINYATGQVTALTFPGVTTAGAPINAQYVSFVASRPLAMLFFQDQFIVRPVPDRVYQVQLDAWRNPLQFDSANPFAEPQLNEWWQLIAYGAADKFFADNADFENLQKFRVLFQEQLKLINRRTIRQQTNQRSSTIYSEQIQYPYNNQFYRF